MSEQDEKTEPWDGYDDASADELIDGVGRKRSPEKLQTAVEYEKAGKNRSTVISAFEDRLGELNAGEPSKGQPGKVRDGDVTSPADTQDTSKRQSTGQVAAEEAEERSDRNAETAKVAAKAVAEGGVAPATVPPANPVYAEENRQDVVAFIGHQLRDSEDVDTDKTYDLNTEKPTVVDHFSVAGNTQGAWVEFNGKTFFLDVQLTLALSRNLAGACTALNN